MGSGNGSEDSGARVARTVDDGSYPAIPFSWYVCDGLMLIGPEAEGSIPVFVPNGIRFRACNLGPNLPPPGTQVICTYIEGSGWRFSF
jgi:hypothetical protein